MYPPALRIHDRKNAIASFDGRDPATRPDTERPVRIGDRDATLYPTRVERPHFISEGDASFSEPETGPPFGLDRVMAPRRFGKDVVTTLGNGHIPLPRTGDERPTMYEDRNTSEQILLRRGFPFVLRRDFPYNPKSSQSRGTVTVTKTRPPPERNEPHPMYPRPVVHMDPGQPPMKSPTMDEDDEFDAAEIEYREKLLAARAYMDKIKEKAERGNTGDGTNDIKFTILKDSINITISKDSSADERVRNAKLLADMGERSQRHRIANDTELRKAKDGDSGGRMRGGGSGPRRLRN